MGNRSCRILPFENLIAPCAFAHTKNFFMGQSAGYKNRTHGNGGEAGGNGRTGVVEMFVEVVFYRCAVGIFGGKELPAQAT